METTEKDAENISNDDYRLRPQITERELLCVNQCGFYGTPQWDGMCSQCWRNHQIDSKRANDYNKNRALLTKQMAIRDNGGAGELIRKSSDAIGLNSIKLILKKSPSMFTSTAPEDQGLSTVSNPPHPSTPTIPRSLSPDSFDAQTRFTRYLYNEFVPQTAKEMDRDMRAFLDKLFQNEHLPLDDLSEMVQQFYQSISDKVLKMKQQPEDFKLSDFIAEVESYICSRAYPILFCTRTNEEAADIALQDRIRALNWVTLGFLETALDFSSEQVQEMLNEAITEMVSMNSYRPVDKKIECLIKCSKHIFDALKESRSGVAASADEFLPVIIFVVLKANPPLIQSNLKFISRFSLPFRVMRGESGYYFTHLSCAIQFILNMNASSLKMSEEEFDAYTQGKRVAPSRINSSVIKSIEQSVQRLNGLMDTDIGSRTNELEVKIEQDCTLFKESVRAFINDAPSEEIQSITKQLNEQPSLADTETLELEFWSSMPSSSGLGDGLS